MGSLGAFLYGHFFHDYAVAISMCFFTLVASELLVSYSSISETFTLRGLFANRFLNISMGISLAVLAVVMYVPVLGDLFTVVPLNFSQIAVCAALILVPIFGSEFTKKLIKT